LRTHYPNQWLYHNGQYKRTMIYPVIDIVMNPKGRNYYQDINECNHYARGASATDSGVISALIGGAFGTALDAVIGAALRLIRQ
jgi:hypothetical protein